MGDKHAAQHPLRGLADLSFIRTDPHAARLAACARMDLGLDHPFVTRKLAGAIDGLFGAIGDTAARHVDAEPLEQFLGLKFVNIHCLSSLALGGDGLGHRKHVAGHAFAGGVDHLAIKACGTAALGFGLF